MRWLFAISAAVALGSPSYADRGMPLPMARRVYQNGMFFVETVRFNTNQAVKCGLRSAGWKDIVVGTAKTQVVADRQWFLARGALSPAELAAITTAERSRVSAMYMMPCRELARMPFMTIYDAAAYRRAPLLMPDLSR